MDFQVCDVTKDLEEAMSTRNLTKIIKQYKLETTVSEALTRHFINSFP